MLAPAHPRHSPWANRMLAMADRLFTEFDALPVRTVFDAIAASRAALREETGVPPSPEQVEALAREQLLRRRVESR